MYAHYSTEGYLQIVEDEDHVYSVGTFDADGGEWEQAVDDMLHHAGYTRSYGWAEDGTARVVRLPLEMTQIVATATQNGWKCFSINPGRNRGIKYLTFSATRSGVVVTVVTREGQVSAWTATASSYETQSGERFHISGTSYSGASTFLRSTVGIEPLSDHYRSASYIL